jgi:Cu+-exporting ATPase
MNITKVKISGMTCHACQRVIENKVGKLQGVEKVKVFLNNGDAEITSDRDLSLEEVKQALIGTHYEVISLI